MSDNVNHPSHYQQGGLECIDVIKVLTGEAYEGFLSGNILKYLWRYKNKNGIEDLKKARWYLDALVAYMTKRDETKKALECDSQWSK